jgi:tRNA (cytidine/uridine-2'-O-)-methyltransferase
MPHQLNIVLVEPEIPQNTGSIGRTCLATGTRLHLIEPLGFEISHSRLRRAGLDYWEHLDVKTWPSAEVFFEALDPAAPKVFLAKSSKNSIYQHRFEPGTWIFLGSETKGFPKWVMEKYSPWAVSIPMYDDRVRSLNLSNAASIVLYEAIRQLGP